MALLCGSPPDFASVFPWRGSDKAGFLRLGSAASGQLAPSVIKVTLVGAAMEARHESGVAMDNKVVENTSIDTDDLIEDVSIDGMCGVY